MPISQRRCDGLRMITLTARPVRAGDAHRQLTGQVARDQICVDGLGIGAGGTHEDAGLEVGRDAVGRRLVQGQGLRLTEDVSGERACRDQDRDRRRCFDGVAAGRAVRVAHDVLMGIRIRCRRADLGHAHGRGVEPQVMNVG